MDAYKETFNTWNAIASLYQDKFMDLDFYNESYDFICKCILKSNPKILEIGCGPGNITKYLLSKRPDFNILGIDVAPNMIALAQKNNPSAIFSIMDCIQIHSFNKKFDAIIGGFCIPYLSQSETRELISNSYDLLNNNGWLYLSFVEGLPDSSEFKVGVGGRVYFNYYTFEDIRKLLIEFNFEELKNFKVNYKISENEFEIHTQFIAKKKNI